MIAVPSVLWQAKTGPFFSDRYSPIIPILIALFQVASIVFLLCTAFSDPGIMPRAQEKEALGREKYPPRHHDLVLRGHNFKIKYCMTCNIYRPPRCTHCAVCDNCIERFDHHCPWIGNCIGKRNYWLFFTFVTTTATLNVAVLATAVGHLIILTEDFKEQMNKGGGDAFVESMKEEPISVALAVYTTAIVWFTVGLCMYHTYLICTNQTTYEQIKGTYSSSANNPFTRGILGNCQDILCSRVRPRYFNAFDGQLRWTSASDWTRVKDLGPITSASGDKSVSTSLKGPRDGGQAKHPVVAVSSDIKDPFTYLSQPYGTAGATTKKSDEAEDQGNKMVEDDKLSENCKSTDGLKDGESQYGVGATPQSRQQDNHLFDGRTRV